jgi:hypothetical protein
MVTTQLDLFDRPASAETITTVLDDEWMPEIAHPGSCGSCANWQMGAPECAACHHCTAGVDDPRKPMVEGCPRWVEKRR